MEQGEIKHRESSIVIVGDFVPLEMAPHWFVKHGLIPQEDVDENLTLEIVYKEITKFSLGNIIIEIREDIVILRSSHQSFDYKIHDLAVGILSSISLKEAAVRGLGLNVYHDVSLQDDKLWHQIGNTLAPKALWSDLSPDFDRIGLMSLQMQIRKAQDVPGVYNFTVALATDIPNGLRFSINNHFELNQDGTAAVKLFTKKGGGPGFDPIALISAYWQQTLDVHVRVIDSLLVNAAQEK